MDEEMNALISRGTWDLISTPNETMIVGWLLVGLYLKVSPGWLCGLI